MARAKKQLIGKWTNESDDTVWVYKAGRSYWINHGDKEHLCHPSVRTLQDTKREAMIVYHVNMSTYAAI